MKKNLLLFIVLFLFQQLTHSQNEAAKLIDSLVAELPKTKDDSIKLELYASIMLEHVSYHPAAGLAYQKDALELAQKLNKKRGIALIKCSIGRLHWRLGNFNEALKNHFEGLAIYIETGNKQEEIKTLLSIGQDYLDDARYDQARNYLMRALKESEKAGDKLKMTSVYDILIYLENQEGNFVEATRKSFQFLKINEELGNKAGIAHAAQMLGASFANIENYEEAAKYFKQSLEVIKDGTDKMEQTFLKGQIGEINIVTGNLPEAESYLSAALKSAREINDAPLLADMHYRMAKLYRAQGNYARALDNYSISAKGLKSVSDKAHLATVYAEMGIVYTLIGDYDKAQQAFNDAMVLNKEVGSIVPLANYHMGRQLFDSATGNWKEAYHHYKRFIFIRDSTLDIASLKKIVGSQMQYDSDKKDALEKAEQEKKDIRTQEELKRQRAIRNSAIAVLAIVLLFSILFYNQRNKIAREKKRSDLLVQDKELLLREIHHRVKNNLEVVSSLLALQSDQIEDANTKDAMLEGQNRVHSIGIVHQKLYQGENLGAIEMKDYFINLSESVLDSFGATGRVDVKLAMEKLNVDIDTAVPLGLIVNELLTNTLKYAFPSNQKGSVQIKLEKQPGNILHLQVSDNGIGKSGSTHGTGFGSQLISLLTRQLNGSMKEDISSGTQVSFDFKLA
jgi:two-component sensor histidine kinase